MVGFAYVSLDIMEAFRVRGGASKARSTARKGRAAPSETCAIRQAAGTGSPYPSPINFCRVIVSWAGA